MDNEMAMEIIEKRLRCKDRILHGNCWNKKCEGCEYDITSKDFLEAVSVVYPGFRNLKK